MDDDGIDDLVVAAKCKNPMADKDEYSFVVADPYDSFLGFGDVKVTSTFGPMCLNVGESACSSFTVPRKMHGVRKSQKPSSF